MKSTAKCFQNYSLFWEINLLVFLANCGNFRERMFYWLLYSALLSDRWRRYELIGCWNKWRTLRSETGLCRRHSQLAWVSSVACLSFNALTTLFFGTESAWIFDTLNDGLFPNSFIVALCCSKTKKSCTLCTFFEYISTDLECSFQFS